MASTSTFNINANAIVIILLGIIACIFPMLSTMTISMISGFAFFMIAISLLLIGLSNFGTNKVFGILNIILGFVAIFFSLSLVFNPSLVSGFISFITYFVGLLMILYGLFFLFVSNDFPYFSYMGIVTIILGILYIILGVFVKNPVYLGCVVGIWLIITGIFDFFKPSRYI